MLYVETKVTTTQGMHKRHRRKTDEESPYSGIDSLQPAPLVNNLHGHALPINTPDGNLHTQSGHTGRSTHTHSQHDPHGAPVAHTPVPQIAPHNPRQKALSGQHPALGSQSPNYPYNHPPYNPKFFSEDVRMLREFLVNGEKYKWKQVTKEINSRALLRRHGLIHEASGISEPEEGSSGRETTPTVKNVSPTFVMKQYQAMLGLPNHAMHFGTLGSSLPYVVAPNGWDDIPDVD